MIRLYDTRRDQVSDLAVQDEARIYVCGITPYDAAHLGHAFTFLTYDLLRRRLTERDVAVTMVRNITDVDDPMYLKASELGMGYLELAEAESRGFRTSMRALNLIDPEVEPRASEHIEQIAALVSRLVDQGVTYDLEGDVYFKIPADQGFGEISRYSETLMTKFSASRGGDPGRPGKKHPLDFLLWRSIADPGDPAAWDTALGRGRPGWHIECTAMAFEHLGGRIDVHGGGTDLIYPHHECENAQGQAAGVAPYTGHWMHTGPMLMGGEKMSKSLGNLVFVKDLLTTVHPAAIRLALMHYHYRNGGEWRTDILRRSQADVRRLRQALDRPDGADPAPFAAGVRTALDDDLDVPRAVDALLELADTIHAGGPSPRAAAGLTEILDLLGLDVTTPAEEGA